MRDRYPGRLLGAALALLCLSGCVERRMVIITDPPHAIVFDEKNQPLGASPVDRSFVYYGKYRYRLVKDGFETLIVDEKIRPKWYEYFPLDFISENLVPWTLRDVRILTYTLQPRQVTSPETVLQEAGELRAKGQTIGTPAPVAPAAPPVALPPPPTTLPSPAPPGVQTPPIAVPPPPPMAPATP
jgi:hypothetical protein